LSFVGIESDGILKSYDRKPLRDTLIFQWLVICGLKCSKKFDLQMAMSSPWRERLLHVPTQTSLWNQNSQLGDDECVSAVAGHNFCFTFNGNAVRWICYYKFWWRAMTLWTLCRHDGATANLEWTSTLRGKVAKLLS